MTKTLSTDRRGLAEQVGAVHSSGCFGLTRADIGMPVDPFDRQEEGERERLPLPPGHRFFPDCDRETNARKIEWMMTRKGVDSWFVTFTFKRWVSERHAFVRLGRWLYAISQAHTAQLTQDGGCFRSGRLSWCVATEWQKRNVIHFHLVLSGVRLGLLSRKRWEHRWEAGHVEGYARIHDADKAAGPYLAKYTSKGLGGNLRWHIPSRGITVPGAVTCCRA